MPPNVAVVVLTWNTRDYTLDCLRSLAGQAYQHTVYLVDNASTDGTAEAVAAAFPAVRIVRNTTNIGFAGGNNVGLAAAFAEGADAALVLNNDTLLEPDAIARLAEAATAHPQAGILSPLILFAAPPHPVWFAGAALNLWTGRSRHAHYQAPRATVPPEPRPIVRATGCAMLITRACYARIGGFDADLFMYYEDVAYSLAARDAGFDIRLVPRAVIYHHVSAASGAVKSANALYYGTRNAILTLDRARPLAMPLRFVRRLLIVLTMLVYIALPPRALALARDVLAGARDARHRITGKRTE